MSTDGGATYPTTIASNVSAGATSGSYPWVVSGPASATARLRVAWAAAPTVVGSTGNLTMAVPTLTVTAPNTAVTWTIGDTRSINWTHNLGTQESVDIDESRDGGTTWSSIATGVANTANATGTFSWVVTGPATTTARVRVTWTKSAAVTDASNVNFTVLDRIRITAPNTAVTWAVGSTHNINWNHNLGTSQSVNIDVSRDGGATWTSVATNVANSTATTGTYAWPVTGPPSATARVRVSWAADPRVTSMSAVNFIISGTISVTSPTGNLGVGSLRTVTWNHNLGAGQTFNILLSTDGGATYPTTIASNVSAGQTSGSYPWVVPGPATATIRLRVAWVAAPTVVGSTGNLTMLYPMLTVTAPNTAVTWTRGTSQAITWSHNLGPQESVYIEESLDGGTTWSVITLGAANTANAAGTFNWLVTGPATTIARIRVTWTRNAAVWDVSNVNFRIQ